MTDKFDQIHEKYNQLIEEMSNHQAGSKEFISITKKIAELEQTVKIITQYKKTTKEIEALKEMLVHQEEKDLLKLVQEEKQYLENKQEELAQKIKELLLPKSEGDEKNAIIEVRPGTGGAEASLFAEELFLMYQRFAHNQNWSFKVLSVKDAVDGGIKEASALIKGDNAFSSLKFESGVHRVQRVPSTETSGRLHTSAATVAVLPEAEEHDVKLLDKDLKIETCRSSGAGGQHVNTTDSAVKITHIPTGFTVVQQGKSQHQNKANGLNILRSRILKSKMDIQNEQRSSERKSQVGSGDRSEKIRTYNFQQDRVTDHRVNITVHNLVKVVKEGNLLEIVHALQTDHKSKMIEQQSDM